jgi:Tfp pilus assembly protein PilF
VLKGFYYTSKRSADGEKRAMDYFNQAVKEDPTFADAYAGLALIYSVSAGLITSDSSPKEAMPKARELAEKALQLDDTVEGAHGTLGLVKFSYDYDWPDAESEYQRELVLHPGASWAHGGYAFFLTMKGRFADAEAQYKRALDLDPLNLGLMVDSALPPELTGRYENAQEQLRKALEMDPNFDFAHVTLGVIDTYRGALRRR